ncbi:DUF4886 domain-containing protein [Draconibacterium sp. IB214405]|uniref:DUF4886 domain-containing protein n=1 Tax=Draconibacterium sp. IB214405 TaxID=3097352 RepID=UPI002A0D656F|nr:DUF4886 domain-containing protein [Draconibacterium sp. IB214405]MDX8339633.1 DUF4886 domain-containing protein [Draconibacterium sp. IB214405]
MISTRKILVGLSVIVVYLLTTVTVVEAHKYSQTIAENQVDTTRLLLIGNSFSHNSTKYLAELAEEAGFPLVYDLATFGSGSMQQHCDWAKLAEDDPQNPKGKPYHGKSLKEMLASQKWDIVSIQQVSILSGDANTYRPYAQKLYSIIKEIQPDTKVVMLETWAYREDADGYAQIAENKHAKSSKMMYKKLKKAYTTIASELNVELLPVGDAFYKVSKSKEWKYDGDKSFDMEKAVFPELPKQKNSMHNGYFWDDDKNIHFDTHHASEAGRYLGSLIWYAYLTGNSPKELDYVPDCVPKDFAEYLKEVAASVSKK